MQSSPSAGFKALRFDDRNYGVMVESTLAPPEIHGWMPMHVEQVVLEVAASAAATGFSSRITAIPDASVCKSCWRSAQCVCPSRVEANLLQDTYDIFMPNAP